ncbi:hypothetical protein Pgy4_37876, partial [Pseudomonas savastanoi pv. glycinea str. race 4]
AHWQDDTATGKKASLISTDRYAPLFGALKRLLIHITTPMCSADPSATAQGAVR